LTYKEGVDIGADVAHGSDICVPDDPLREASPLPEDESLPGWRAAVAAYYSAMGQVAGPRSRSIAPSLQLSQVYFDDAFDHGLSTLRLMRYPPRAAAELAAVQDPRAWVEVDATRRYLVGAPHTDSGFITLLEQDGVGGLQARSRDGRWIDVPPLADTLVVN